MKTNSLLILAAILSAHSASAQGGAKEGFAAFRQIRSRNIFDPARRPSRPDSAPRTPVQTRRESRGRSNYIVLTGTMVTDGKALAFFNGSQAEYQKVVPVNQSIADFKITRITSALAEFEHNGARITVPVGQQLPLQGSVAATAGGAPLTSADGSQSPAETAGAGDAPAAGGDAPPAAANGDTPAPAAPAGGPSDVLRRMMEKRQKELSK